MFEGEGLAQIVLNNKWLAGTGEGYNELLYLVRRGNRGGRGEVAATYLGRPLSGSSEGEGGGAPTLCELLYFCGDRVVASLFPL
jgi:hypothetical protein